MTKQQRLVLGFESYAFVQLAGQLAAMAGYLGISKEIYMVTVVNAWNRAVNTVTEAEKDVEQVDVDSLNDLAEQVEKLSKDKN